MRSYNISRSLLCLALVALFCGIVNTAVAADKEEQITTTITGKFKQEVIDDDPGMSKTKVAQASIHIETESILFYITPKSQIKTRKGKQLTIKQLPIPCKATITYQKVTKNNPNALLITVESYKRGYTQKWSEPQIQ